MYSFIDRTDPPARPTRSFEDQCWELRSMYLYAPLPGVMWDNFSKGNRAQRAAKAKREDSK
jgi:hypothetical protein